MSVEANTFFDMEQKITEYNEEFEAEFRYIPKKGDVCKYICFSFIGN